MEQLQLEKWQVSNGYTRGKTVITFGRTGWLACKELFKIVLIKILRLFQNLCAKAMS
jgi:hypothetical protein